MTKLFIVVEEYPGSGDIKIGVFTTLRKATKAFEECLRLNDNHNEWQRLKDEEEDKEYYYTDGSYGWTITMIKIPKNEMWAYA